MKKYYYYLIVIFAFMLAIPSITRAVSLKNSTGKEIQNEMSINFQNRVGNAKDNQQMRNDRLRALQDDATNTRQNIKENASSSSERKGIRQNMRIDIFKTQLNKIARELNKALSNLKQIRARIFSRIQKAEQGGRNMTEAKNLLIIADGKITTAQLSINTLASSTATSREIANTATKAVKDAKEALNVVVLAIAHSMGLKLGLTASTTPPITSTSTATSTATTTP